jgi:hypothetical protein
MRFRRWPLIVGFIIVGAATSPPVVGRAQALGKPDRGAPGDEMIQAYLKRATEEISSHYSDASAGSHWRPPSVAQRQGRWPLSRGPRRDQTNFERHPISLPSGH